MTISTELRKAGPFTGNGVTTAFPFSFKVFAASDVAVTRADTQGAETALVLNSDFTVALNPDQDAAPGGTVTLAAQLATGHRLTVTSAVPNLQPTDITNNGGFYPRVIEDALDRHVAQIQQIDEKVDRALKVAITSPLGDQALPSPVAGMLIGWNESNDGLKNYAPIGGTLLGQQLAAANGSSLVGFQQAGTGAVVRTAQDKMREWVSVKDFGAVGDGVTDDTAAIVAALNGIQDGQILDLVGGEYALFVGNNGVTTGDAIPLADVPRLYNRNNITIRNGRLFAANPGASGTKVRYPTTFTVDGCTGITFENVSFESRGENYGDTDASAPLTYDERRAFAAQNGGHALLIVRSYQTTANNCSFIRCGSVGTFYAMSSDETVANNCYVSPMSLGYAAYAMDGWAGTPSTTGFVGATTTLNSCSTDNNGATYGSKGCVVTEDTGTTVYINGGVYRDAYANGADHYIGNAFTASSSTIYVTGAQVDNCASLGYTASTDLTDSVLEVVGVIAKNIRTSMHIVKKNAFGNHYVKYNGCNVAISGTSLWSDDYLSVPTVIANDKITSGCSIDIVDCITSGAHTFSINPNECYGGVRVIGGEHNVTDRIFDSAGWGGASAGTWRGFELLNTRFNVLLANTSIVSTAITQATTAMNAIENRGPNSVYTYLYLDFDSATHINSNLYRQFMTLTTYGSASLIEKLVLAQELNSCFQSNSAGVPRTTTATVVSLDGIAGSNVQVTFAFSDNRIPSGGKIVGDDAYANRALLSAYSAATAVGTELHQGWYVNGSTYNLTVGDTYSMITGG